MSHTCPSVLQQTMSTVAPWRASLLRVKAASISADSESMIQPLLADVGPSGAYLRNPELKMDDHLDIPPRIISHQPQVPTHHWLTSCLKNNYHWHFHGLLRYFASSIFRIKKKLACTDFLTSSSFSQLFQVKEVLQPEATESRQFKKHESRHLIYRPCHLCLGQGD